MEQERSAKAQLYIFRKKPHGSLAAVPGRLTISQATMGVDQERICLAKVGLLAARLLDRPLQVTDRLFVLADVVVGHAEIEEREWMFGAFFFFQMEQLQIPLFLLLLPRRRMVITGVCHVHVTPS